MRNRRGGRPRTLERDAEAQNHTPTEQEQAPSYQCLAALVHEPDATVAHAVQQTIEICEPSCTAYTLSEIAQQTPPEKQSKLVAFVHELQKVQILDEKTGKQNIYPEDQTGELLWSELPTFGVTWADEWQSLTPTSLNTPAQRMRVENFNIFIAKLCASREAIFDDLLSYADSAFGGAFGPWFHHSSQIGLGRWDRYRPSDHQDTVRVACLWFVYAADRVWDKVQMIEDGTWKWRTRDECAWCKSEWNRWKTGLVESRVRLRNVSTRELIAEALEAMGKCENSKAS